jgi:hypothetical protein
VDRAKLHVYVDFAAYAKMLAYAKAAENTEIGGLLEVEDLGNRGLYVKAAKLVKQEVSAGSVDFTVGEFESHIKEKGWWGKPMPHLCMGIWHSHVDMSVFMSAIDENDLVRKYACRGWLVNIVVNKKGEMLVQVDSHVGPETGKPDDYVLVTVPSAWSIWYGDGKEVKKELEEFVEKKTFTGFRRGEFADKDDKEWAKKSWKWDPKKGDLVDEKGISRADWDKLKARTKKEDEEKRKEKKEETWRPSRLSAWSDEWEGGAEMWESWRR